MYTTYLFHFQHESGRIGFKVVVHADPGENLIGNAERGVVCRYARAWENNAGALEEKREKKSHLAACGRALKDYFANLSEP